MPAVRAGTGRHNGSPASKQLVAGLLALGALGVLAPAALAPAAVAATHAGEEEIERRPGMFKDGRGELALARVRGEASIRVVAATVDGRVGRVAERMAALGGQVEFRDDEVGYLRASLPLDALTAMERDADVLGIEPSIPGGLRSYDLVGGAPAPEPPRPAKPRAHDPACPAPDLPLTRAYSPLRSMGAAGFRREHPTFDGRGVTLALLDGTPDLMLPELQTALTLDGAPVRKIADVRTVVDPDAESGRDAASWVDMRDATAAADQPIDIAGLAHAPPRPGRFRAGLLDESRFTGGDLDRDGNPEGSDRRFGVLWDPASGEVWVDTDQDRDFGDEPALRDYRLRGEIGAFGTDDPATAVRDAIPFAVQTDPARGRVAILAGYYPHPTKVIGAAIASRGTDGRLEGAAPGARLVSIRQGATAHGHIEGAIDAAHDSQVDVIVVEQHSTVDTSYGVRDGRLVVSIVLGRLAQRFGKLVVVPASNLPALAATTEVGQAPGILAVGASQDRANLLRNRGLHAAHEENLHAASSFGPGGDGALKPDLLAPSDLISTDVAYLAPRAFGPGDCYLLPPGYALSNGTSTSAPMGAAAAALLISAARQRGIAHDADRIRTALMMGARRVANLASHQQGAGLIDVEASWRALQHLDRRGLPPRVIARAPVRTPFAHLLPAPGVGRGLFETEGWSPGMSAERIVTLTRTGGPDRPVAYSVEVEGGSGVFAAEDTVVLPLGRPVGVRVRIAIDRPGVHSAALRLSHPDFPGPAQRVLMTVVAPIELVAEGGTYREQLALQRAERVNRYLRVAPEARELTVAMDVPEGDAVLLLRTPDGRSGSWGALVSGGRHQFDIPDPMPGVWEIVIMPGRDPSRPTPLEEAARPIAASLQASSATTVARADPQAMPRARTFRRRISAGEQHVYEVEVPPGTAVLLSRLEVADDATGSDDLDLYAFDCTDRLCMPAQADARPRGTETMRIANPAAGRWKIVVDAFRAGAGTSYEYTQTLIGASGAGADPAVR